MKLIHFCIIFLTLAMLSCSETGKSRYANYAEAESEKLFERGGLPKIIPKSSERIVTVNDLDVNVSEGEFVYSDTDEAEFLAHLKRASGLDTDHYEVYTYEGWVFFLNSAKQHCKYRLSSSE